MAQTFASKPSAAPSSLANLAAAGGGFPYYAGRAARIEPTAWSLLALMADRKGAIAGPVARARAFLHGLQQADGILLEPGVPVANYAWNGLALLALSDASDQAVVDKLATALLRAKGMQVQGDERVVRVNTNLQAWSWIDGTFSWLEPTAWCLLALKARHVQAPAVAERVATAEAVIVDRVCESGGWNYGNSQVLAQDLRPYVPTTALTLLAMQDKRGTPSVAKSLAWLEAHATSERSTLALGLTALALHVYGRPTTAVLEALGAQVARTSALGNVHLKALAHYATRVGEHDARAFRVTR